MVIIRDGEPTSRLRPTHWFNGIVRIDTWFIRPAPTTLKALK